MLEDKIKTKLLELEKAKEQTIANLTAIEGAIQVLTELLTESKDSEKK